jgi:eukaryotic-like serine/threonine-protein kinase
MSASRWSRLKELVQGALELEPGERAAFLAEACGDDAVLLREAEELLEGADSAEPGFLEPPDLEPESAAGLQGAARSAAPLRLGEFELLDEVGRGGVGVVYRARQIGLDRIVAVKVLETGLATSEQAILRFEHEARAVAKLHHEGIVPIYAVGVDGVNHWFAMEFVQGGDLAQELQRQRLGRDHRLPLPETPGHASSVAARMRSVARALQAAHDVGVVHRDVKPQNLLIDEDGNLRLADFGLAKDASQGSISISGELLGTPYYMSPEQARARRESIDHRTDVYSAGAVL